MGSPRFLRVFVGFIPAFLLAMGFSTSIETPTKGYSSGVVFCLTVLPFSERYNWGGGWVHIFKPNLILDVRGGALTKPAVFDQAKSDVGIDTMKKLGFSDVDKWGGMTASLGSPWFGNEMGNREDSIRRNPDWNVAGNLNWIKGNHNFRTGYQYIWVARDQINTYQTFGFGKNQTANPKSTSNTGLSLASALLALPSDFSGELPDYGEVHFRLAAWSAYAQDEWKVKPRLTVTIGLRYDCLTQPRAIGPRLLNALDLQNRPS